MTQAQLEKFIVYLQKNDWSIFGPVLAAEKIEELSPFLAAHQFTLSEVEKRSGSTIKQTGPVLIKKINKASELALDGQLPFFSFKRFFVPEKERLFTYKGNSLVAQKHDYKICLLGVDILDLKAVNLYDQVFEKDPYYQKRRRNLLVVGHSLTPQIENNIFEHKYEEDILEHLPFDIFLAENHNSSSPPLNLRGGRGALYKVFSGSIKGQRILEHFGYKYFEHIQFSGPVKEGKIDARMERLRDRLKNHHNVKIWDELGKICIECGKCTTACPTCFCSRLDDVPAGELGSGTRDRCWDSCYYREFSEVSGPDKLGSGKPKFLNSTAERLHFWYYHKFARIPDEFDFMGCVGCHRCAKVCPVGIDITEVLKKIENS